MARIVYFDCFSGVSGDMVLGALLDAGLPLDGLRAALGSLAIEYGMVSADRVQRAGVAATKFVATEGQPDAVAPVPHHQHGSHGGRGAPHHERHEPDGVHTFAVASEDAAAGHRHHHHSLSEITAAIERSSLSRSGKDRAVRMFYRLAEVEAAIHDVPLDRVHLHEVGALDSIIDIVGTVHGMEWLGADDVVASALNVGSGTVRCEHGTFPVPAPATASLLKGAPIYAGSVAAELVTPTGALIVTEYARRFGALPTMRLERVAYGAGDRDEKGHPNVLRLLIGDAASGGAESIVVLECEIDDMNPQLFGPLMDRLIAAGALDVFYVPAHMKKNRPGTLVTVIAPPDRRQAIADRLFAETTTIGVRYQEMARERLDREVRTVSTPAGAIGIKVAMRDGRVLNASPEFEDCARAAAERGLAIKDVQAMAMKAWLDMLEGTRDKG
ncbi:MAG TPA: nickel pincer cofactor biosynthesis protein LarC [Vicinamibacterales bacterium]|nr:nickel pincer cofactor biosynthesis protein LarC [Vicinamibacterales bacterium]